MSPEYLFLMLTLCRSATVTSAGGNGVETLYTEAEVAERYRRKPETVRDWRKRRKGPDFIKAGGTVLYPESALEAWEKSRRRELPKSA
jgi:Helix-turn-helix domain